MLATVRCHCCNDEYTIALTDKQWDKWENGSLFQDSFSGLTAENHELLVNHICPTCFDQKYPEQEQI
jgi:hypothetical protein